MNKPTDMTGVYAATLEQNFTPIIIFSDTGALLYANARFQGLFSLRYANFPESPGLLAFQRHVVEIISGGLIGHVPFEEKHLVGFPERPFQARYERIALPDEGAGYVVVISLTDCGDETSRTEHERRAQKRLQDFALCSSDWLWEVDDKGRIISLSDQFTQVMGVPCNLFFGLDFAELGSLKLPAAPSLCDTPNFKQQRPFRDWLFELTLRSGEKRLQRLSGLPIHDDAGSFAGFRGTGTDVTDQMRVQDALRTSRDRLDDTVRALSEKSVDLLLALESAEAANRTQAEFLANVSHELRTPLNAIIGFSEILCTNMFGPLGNERYQGYATDIHISAKHLDDLISNVLDLSRAELGGGNIQPVDIDVDDEVRYCIRVIEAKAKAKSLDLAFQPEQPGLRASADQRAFRQIVTNLLSNAVKFTPDRGSVEVRARQVQDKIEIAVSDTGIGILPDDLPKVTRPFIRGSQISALRQEGTGLGLAVTKSLTELHGGQIDIKSVPDQGTTVTVTLPVSQQEATLAYA